MQASPRTSLANGTRQFGVGVFAFFIAACTTTGDRVPVLEELQVAPDEETAEFQAVGDPFSSASACTDYLARLVPLFSPPAYEVARGPYAIDKGDIRAHAVSSRSGEYQVTEYRCYGSAIEARSWSVGPAKPGIEPFTLEDIQEMTFPPDEES